MRAGTCEEWGWAAGGEGYAAITSTPSKNAAQPIRHPQVHTNTRTHRHAIPHAANPCTPHASRERGE